MYLTFGYDVHRGTPLGEQHLIEVPNLVVIQHPVAVQHLGRTHLVRTHLVAEQHPTAEGHLAAAQHLAAARRPEGSLRVLDRWKRWK